ncbi:MAG: amino acid adenylation domain-containing protein, partial [Pseudomonadota bacterium]
LNPADDIYINQMQITLGGISATDFRRAWVTVCHRHTIFRTGFEAVGASGEYMQILHDEAPHDVRVLQKGALDINAICKEDRVAGFDLAKPPLSRLTIVEGGADNIHLIWTCHHLLTDGWSLGNLLGEVLAFAENPDISLPPARPFKDHIAALTTRPIDKDTWARRLADLEAPTRLSEAFADPDAPAADHSLSLPKSLITALDQRASMLGITLNTLFQAALVLTLRRFQHDSTLCFGVTTSGRHDMPADQPAIGLYISTLPLVCTLADQDMDDWLRDLQQQGIDLLNHEGDGLNAIAEQAPQNGGELFDTLFVFENYPLDAVLRTRGKDTWIVVQDYTLEERTNYPLTISVIPHDDTVLKLASNAGAFGKDGLVRIGETMVAALNALSASSGKSVYDVRRMLGTNPTFPPHSDEPTAALTDRFTEIVARQPHAFAVRDTDIRLTYQQLDHQANALAHRIIDAGANNAKRIGLACDRLAHLIIGMLAILKTGKAYVPLDPANPEERLRYIIEDAGLHHIVTDQDLPDSIDGAISVGDLQGHNQPPDVPPGQAAYLIYTSGSTGQPKGVEVTHANVLHLLNHNRYDFDSRDVWAAFHAYSFDFSVWEIFGALISGGEVVMVPYLTSRDPKAMTKLLRDCGVSIFCQTPTAFHQILPELLKEPAAAYRLRHLFLGAEVIDLSSLDPIWTHFKDLQVHNLYGPTEATVFVTHHTISQSDAAKRKNAPLGKATPNTGLFLLDDLGQEVPDGVPGELFVSGPSVTNGYLNKADLNDQAFPTRHGQRLYKTGDLLKRGPDGLFEFCGRADHQIKLRGFRIELGEVEAALRGIEGIIDAAVILHQTDLAGYYVGEPGIDIKTVLAAHLPNHMVPRWLIGLPALPVTPNGKLNRRALPPPIDQKRVGREPITQTEMALAQIWQDLLGLENVFADDDFFVLGGHSLLVTRLRTKIEQEFDLTIPLKTLFESRRLSQVATHIDQTKTADDGFDDLTALMDELET